jgi:tetratricopeptide (TPR) repeat protein
MKKVLFTMLSLFLAVGISSAQEDGAKLAKSAGKALTSYNIDPSGNAAKLGEARDKIEQALKLPEVQAIGSAWQTKGEIYSTLLQKDLALRTIDPKAKLKGDNDALVAFDAYKKAYELATKKYEKGDAIKGILEVQPSLINIGVSKYEIKEYDKAFLSFKASVESHNLLKANNQKSYLDDPNQYNDQVFFTGLIGSMANRCADAIPFLETPALADSAKTYDPLYNCKLAVGDEAGAAKVLTEGRKRFPEDPGLLFAEINSYLKAGKLAELTGRLEQAIKQEPGNVGLYVTLGNVYDNLYQGALKEKNDAKAKEYFDQAKLNYTNGLAKNPDHVDANYSLGALYFNKAAVRTQEMNALPEDFSSAGLKKMESMRNEVMALFELALPFFQRAESVDPNDMNTLIALNEIYARKDDEVLSPEIKKRLDVVKGGGKNASAYFKH